MAELELAPKRVRTRLGKLIAAGIARVDEDRRTYRLDPETLRRAAELVGPPREAGLSYSAPPPTTRSMCFARSSCTGRLTEIPMKQTKRRIVLERIALEFEPGRRYEEQEVNVIVGAFFNDHAALRRYLVDEGFLDRDHGV